MEDTVHKEPIYATIPADVASKPGPPPNYISGPPPEGKILSFLFERKIILKNYC